MAHKNKRLLRDLAMQRISWLFDLSLDAVRRNNIELARRYVKILIAISRKANMRLPQSIKHSICKKCYAPLLPGVTANIRLKSDGKSSRIIVKCRHCGWIYRYPYKPRRKSSREKEEKHD